MYQAVRDRLSAQFKGNIFVFIWHSLTTQHWSDLRPATASDKFYPKQHQVSTRHFIPSKSETGFASYTPARLLVLNVQWLGGLNAVFFVPKDARTYAVSVLCNEKQGHKRREDVLPRVPPMTAPGIQQSFVGHAFELNLRHDTTSVCRTSRPLSRALFAMPTDEHRAARTWSSFVGPQRYGFCTG